VAAIKTGVDVTVSYGAGPVGATAGEIDGLLHGVAVRRPAG
jgi:hypothetical protein